MVWEANAGTRICVCRGHNRKIYSAVFRPDGTRLLTASADGTVCQWDSRTGKQVELPFEHHSGEVRAATYSPDGEWVASGGSDRTVRLWRAADRREEAILHGHTGHILELAFSPDGRRVISRSEDETVRIWEAGMQATLPVIRGHASYIYPVTYSPNGKWIASGSWDNTARVWDARTGEMVGKYQQLGTVEDLTFSRDSLLLYSASRNEGICIWNVLLGEKQGKIAGTADPKSLSLCPDGRQLAALDSSGILRVYDLRTSREVARTDNVRGDLKWPLAWSPDGSLLAVQLAEHKIGLWNIQSQPQMKLLSGHTGQIQSLAFSPTGEQLLSTSLDQTIHLWNVESGEGRILPGPSDEIFVAVFHPDGSRIALAGRDQLIRIWDVKTGEELAQLKGHTSYIWSLAFSPDGKSLISGSGMVRSVSGIPNRSPGGTVHVEKQPSSVPRQIGLSISFWRRK